MASNMMEKKCSPNILAVSETVRRLASHRASRIQQYTSDPTHIYNFPNPIYLNYHTISNSRLMFFLSEENQMILCWLQVFIVHSHY